MKPCAESHPLTESQKELVSENVALVNVHLKRHRADYAGRDDRCDEWNDLFQDGCVGLIEAARTFDPAGRGKFAAYALYRIHSAGSRSQRNRRSSVRLPDRVGRHRLDAETRRSRRDANPSSPPRMVPKVVSRPYQALDQRPNFAAPSPADDTVEAVSLPAQPSTVGEYMRAKIEAACEVALGHAHDAGNSRTDRQNLARVLVEQRLMVPEEDARASLREIAERTGSSYGRVAHCEAALLDRMRECLAQESELSVLRAAARREAHGLDSDVDPELRTRLLDAAAAQALGIFTRAPSGRRAEILVALIESLTIDVLGLFRAYAAKLNPGERTAWLAQMRDLVDKSK
jgi:RNA polymerase sigma factor (sigma-70 family)